MPYFQYTENSHHYPDEWEDLLQYIKNDWPSDYSRHLGDLNHQIEAKALHVLSLARHLIDRAEQLPVNENWQPVFVEASIILFPMIEQVGEARLGSFQNQGSWRRLASGLEWLMDPTQPPQKALGTRNNFSIDDDRLASLGNFMGTYSIGPRIRELYHLRNYFVHGLRDQTDLNFDVGALQSSMNYELPYAIIEQAKIGLSVYWDQLRTSTASQPQNWVTRLAEAKIYPFQIMGSGFYERGLVDYDILYCLP